MEGQYERITLMIQDEGLEKLRKAKVLIVGLGGVGGYAAEALARTGIGKLVLMDHDEVSLTNLNRQIIANYGSIGQSKVTLMKDRITTYSDTKVHCIQAFYDADSTVLDSTYDYVIDACDTLSAKVALIKHCHQLKVNLITSLGMANRLDSSKVLQTTLDKTTYDPLAKALREQVKKDKISYKVHVVCSTEIPFKQSKLVNPNGLTLKEKYPPASCVFVPAAAGLLLASIVVRKIVEC